MPARPSIDPTAFIGPHVTIWGDVTIGAEAVILPGVVMRAEMAPIRIGHQSNVQDNVVIHTDEGRPTTVGSRVTIGHLAMLHGCTVADGALVGMSTTLLNGSIVGPGAMVAAGSLVPPGMEIPPGMLALGNPAKVRRPLTDEEVAAMEKGIEHYLAHAAAYRAAGLG